MALSETWFLDGYIDFELQKYRLLSYLQEVNKYFNEQKLYPQLGDLIFHYHNLENFRKNKELLQNNFPKELDSVNAEKVKLVYRQMLDDDEVMKELENITGYAMNKFKTTIDNGTELYELVEQRLKIEPIGILPIYKNEGYIFFSLKDDKEVKVYNYNISLFSHDDTRYRSLRIHYIDTWRKTMSVTYEQMKHNIIKTIKTLPNPAVFLMESPPYIPFHETLLPVAKRTLVKYINDNTA